MKFLIKFSSETLLFPIDKAIFPSLSFFISSCPDFISFTDLIISFVTVPSFGFGINPFGPKIFPSLPNLIIILGVDTSFSKLIFPAEILLIKSSEPITSAALFFASSNFSSSQITATLIFLQPTSPLILSQDINTGLDELVTSGYDSLFSVYREHWIPRWSLHLEPQNWNINNRPMRQDIDELLVENGALYISTRKQLIGSKLRYGGKVGYIEMPLHRSFQIDTYDDVELIKKLL